MLERLREQLGRSFPPPTPEAMLSRAGKWLEARDYRRARAEYESLVPQLGGAQRELAQVRAGAACRTGGAADSAFAYLKALTLRSPEADAERLYYLVECARSVEDPAAMLEFVSRLDHLYPASEWRLSALIWAGNYYLLRNEPASYVPLYRACYEGFPADPRASYCHWKVAWDAYLQRRAEAGELLRDHLKRFPQSEKRAAALYFLGRLSEASDGLNAAQPVYAEIVARYPNNFYAQLAADRRGGAAAVNAAPLSFEPSAITLRRISRARLLSSAGLSDFAESELRFAAREDGQPQVMALELARQAAARDAPDQGLRYIKAVFPDYLATPLDAAPTEFWRLAFPLPFRPYLERYGKAHQLDLYLLAGLIRQESEFNPRAVSVAGARGLMQVMPSSGQQLARTLKTRGFRTSSLFRPDLNIQFGCYYLRDLIDTHEGSREAALAAYNGGSLRAENWLTWATYKEPAEFVETIPFTETRTYVQAVLRNAWMYSRIYGPAAAKR
jgi:soluble lytic murein transglycosylase